MARSRKRKVYLDSSVLGHWLLYRNADKPKIAEAPTRVKNSLLLLNQIKQGLFSCKFETSDFAYTELHQVFRDNIIANKIVKDAQSLVYFHELKKQYELTEDEIDDLDYYFDDFSDFLNKLKVNAYVVTLDMHDVQDLITSLNLSTPDAMHLAWAATARYSYDYFVTNDRDFLDFKEQINEFVKKPKIAKPSALHTIKELRK